MKRNRNELFSKRLLAWLASWLVVWLGSAALLALLLSLLLCSCCCYCYFNFSLVRALYHLLLLPDCLYVAVTNCCCYFYIDNQHKVEWNKFAICTLYLRSLYFMHSSSPIHGVITLRPFILFQSALFPLFDRHLWFFLKNCTLIKQLLDTKQQTYN